MKWGNWKIDTDKWALVFDNGQCTYPVLFRNMDSSAQILDMIIQVSGKSWMSAQDKADFIWAIDLILAPQSNFCASGMDIRAKGQDVAKDFMMEIQ